MTDQSFNPQSRICLACMVRLKVYPDYDFERPKDVHHFWAFVFCCIEYAVRSDPGNNIGLQQSLLDKLNNVAVALTTLMDGRSCTLLDQYHRSDGKWRQHWSATGSYGNTSFINLAVQLQLTEYVRNAFSQPSIRSAISDFDLLFMLQQATLEYNVFSKARDPSKVLSSIMHDT